MIPNQCEHLDVLVQNTKLTWSMHYCRLLPKGNINSNFETVAKKFKELHPDISIVPNGECPWAPYNEFQECPLCFNN